MEDVKVILTGPAKVNGKWRKAGDPVTVNETVLAELRAAGVVPGDEDAVAEYVKGKGDLRAAVAQELTNRAVATAVAKRDAHWSTALDHFQSMAADEKEDALAALSGEHRAELETLDGELDAAKARIAELEAGLATFAAGAEQAGKALVAAAKPDTPADQKSSAAKKT